MASLSVAKESKLSYFLRKNLSQTKLKQERESTSFISLAPKNIDYQYIAETFDGKGPNVRVSSEASIFPYNSRYTNK